MLDKINKLDTFLNIKQFIKMYLFTGVLEHVLKLIYKNTLYTSVSA